MDTLLVTADRSLRSALHPLLSDRGHTVAVCTEAVPALERAQTGRFPLIILDECLPDAPGPAVCRRLRSFPEGERTAILYVASTMDTARLAAALDAGADDVVGRPLTPSILVTRLLVAEQRVRERAERARVEQEHRITRVIVDNSPTMLFRTRATGDGRFAFEYVSENVHRLGYTPAELLSGAVSYQSLIHPDDRERVMREGLARLERGDTRLDIVYRLCTRDGHTRWVDDRTTVVRDADGRIVSFEGMLVDITERRDAEDALRQSEARFRTLVQNVSDIIAVIEADGTLRYVSPAVERLLGYRPEELIGRNVAPAFHPDDLARTIADLNHRGVVAGVNPSLQFRLRHRDGSWRTFEAIANNLLGDPDVRGVVVTGRDVSDRLEAERTLRESEERFRKVFEASPIGMALIGTDGHAAKVNATLCTMLDAAEAELVGRNLAGLSHPDDRPAVAALTDRMLAGEIPGFRTEQRYLTKSGEVVWTNLTATLIRGTDGSPLYGVVMIENITQRKLLEQRLMRQAFRDPLTDLPNRTLFLERLEDALAGARRRRVALALLFLDLDGFKHVNDTLGHACGDELLTAVAERLTSCLRPGDMVARFGGDEFIVLLEDIHEAKDAVGVAERIHACLRAPFRLDGHAVTVTASIGIAFGRNGSGTTDLLRDADVALYRAKAEGKARHVVFDPAGDLPVSTAGD
jgi:diguanylate cyclase (GGDEF)-like protein/PAS domain S-box-containing protein